MCRNAIVRDSNFSELLRSPAKLFCKIFPDILACLNFVLAGSFIVPIKKLKNIPEHCCDVRPVYFLDDKDIRLRVFRSAVFQCFRVYPHKRSWDKLVIDIGSFRDWLVCPDKLGIRIVRVKCDPFISSACKARSQVCVIRCLMKA